MNQSWHWFDLPWTQVAMKRLDGTDQTELVGFVYEIEDLVNGKKYVGKKRFWVRKIYHVKKKKKYKVVPSDWESYYGSNKELQAAVDADGPERFHRQILHLCLGKGEMNYLEAMEQFARGVLLEPGAYYNEWIQCKVHRSHLKLLIEKTNRNKNLTLGSELI